MIVDHDTAVLAGLCPGSYEPPEGVPGACSACGWPCGLAGGVVAPHVHEPGPAELLVDSAWPGRLETYRAYNAEAPGLLIVQPESWIFDEWQIMHTITGAVLHDCMWGIHPEHARLVARQLGQLWDWVNDWEAGQECEELHLRVAFLTRMAWLAGHQD